MFVSTSLSRKKTFRLILSPSPSISFIVLGRSSNEHPVFSQSLSVNTDVSSVYLPTTPYVLDVTQGQFLSEV